MKVQDLILELERVVEAMGNVDVVIWDVDWCCYYQASYRNLDIQIMEDGSHRVSIGVNSRQDERAGPPLDRWAYTPQALRSDQIVPRCDQIVPNVAKQGLVLTTSRSMLTARGSVVSH